MLPLRELALPEVSGTTYTYTFPAISQGLAASVTVSVPGTPPTASWTVYAGSLPVASLAGANAITGLYLSGGEQCSIVGTSPTSPGSAVEVGQLGSLAEVPVTVPTVSPGATTVGNELNVTGTVDATVSGSVDANITNANIPVTGTVEVSTAAGSTVDVTGSTVSIAAGQVVEVTNESGGSLTVAGTVNIGTTPTITVDANGSTINIDELLNTITVGHRASATDTLTFTAQPGTTNLLVILPFPLGGSNTIVVPTVTTSGSGIVGVPRPVLATSAITVWEIATINPGTVTVTIPSAATWNVAEVVGRLPWAAVGTITYVVPNPTAGSEWSFTLPYAAQLTRLSAKFLAGSTTANRWLYLVTSQSASYGGYIPLSSAATTANAQVLVGAATGPPAVPVTEAGLGITLARLPEGPLPAGLSISSFVEGFQASDQWSSIQVDLVDP